MCSIFEVFGLQMCFSKNLVWCLVCPALPYVLLLTFEGDICNIYL